MAPFTFCTSVPSKPRCRPILGSVLMVTGLILGVPAQATGLATPSASVPLMGGTQTPVSNDADNALRNQSTSGRSRRKSAPRETERPDEAWGDPCVGPMPHQSLPTS
jgi:hypothetical protein